MARLLDALLLVDNLARAGVRLLGVQSSRGREFRDAAGDLRREVAARALAEEAAQFDPKTDLKRIFAAAEAAGLTWPDMRDALNDYREHHPGCLSAPVIQREQRS